MEGFTLATWPGRGGDLNPFINIFVDSLEKVGCDVVSITVLPLDGLPDGSAVVIHWPQFLYKDSFGKWAKISTLLHFIAFLLRLKRKRVKVIWLCHDLKPHDWNTWVWKALWWPTLRALFLMSDGIIALSPGTQAMVEQRYSRWIRGRLDWAWHPSYENVLVSESVRAEIRESFEITEPVSLIGFFGQLRLQKGVEDLLHTFCQTEESSLHLLIAGAALSSATAVADDVVSASQRDRRVHCVLRKLEDEEIKNLVSACDLCVFPYREYTHSGAMIYSLCAHRRILTPRTPFSESLAEALPDWVELYDGSLTPQILRAAAEKEVPKTPPDLSPFSAVALAEKVVELASPEK